MAKPGSWRSGDDARFAPVLRLVLPKGSLEKATLELFDAADLTVRRSSSVNYRASIDDPRVESVRILRPQEIPHYVADGLFDIGITGRDWVEETSSDVVSLGELKYSKVTSNPIRVVVAVPEDSPVTSVADLWREDLQGRVVVLSEMRDTLGVMMSSQGVDITKFTADDFYNALDEVEARVTDGYIRNIKGNSYSEDLVSEDALAGIVWSGDITVLNLEAGYEKWKFVLPDSGGTFWNDTFMVPIGSPRKTNAEKLINWYYDPAIAAQVAAWVNYVTPVNGAYEEAIKIDPALAENQLIFPNADTLSQVSIFRSLSDAEENEFQAAFQGVLLG